MNPIFTIPSIQTQLAPTPPNEEQRSVPWDRLPPDILHTIFSRLEAPDLIPCAQVHRYWRAIAINSFARTQTEQTIRFITSIRAVLEKYDMTGKYTAFIERLNSILPSIPSCEGTEHFSSIELFLNQVEDSLTELLQTVDESDLFLLNSECDKTNHFLKNCFEVARRYQDTIHLSLCYSDRPTQELQDDFYRELSDLAELSQKKFREIAKNVKNKESLAQYLRPWWGNIPFELDDLPQRLPDQQSRQQTIQRYEAELSLEKEPRKRALLLSKISCNLLSLHHVDQALHFIELVLFPIAESLSAELQHEDFSDVFWQVIDGLSQALCRRGEVLRALHISKALQRIAPLHGEVSLSSLSLELCRYGFYEKALEIIRENTLDSGFLFEIAKTLIQDSEFSKAEVVIDKIDGKEARSSILCKLGEAYYERGLLKKAFETIGRSDDPFDEPPFGDPFAEPFDFPQDIIDDWIRNKQDDQALEAIHNLPNACPFKTRNLEFLASHYISHNRVDEAIGIAKEIPTAHMQRTVLRPQFERLFALESFDKAEEIATSCPDPERSNMLGRLFIKNFHKIKMARALLSKINLEALREDIRDEVLLLKGLQEQQTRTTQE